MAFGEFTYSKVLDGEAIEFPTGNPSGPARLTKETRLRLLRAAEVTERTEEIQLRGGVHAIDQDEMTFEVMLPDGTKVPGPIPKKDFETILDASYGYKHGYKILLYGVGRYSRSDRLEKIESVEHVTPLDPLDFHSQLEELRILKDGWYDGEGRALPEKGLTWLAGAFDEHYPENLSLPYVYPVAEGGVRLEWSLGLNEPSVQIDLDQRIGQWHSLNLTTDNEETKVLKFEAKEDWHWLVQRLQDLTESQP